MSRDRFEDLGLDGLDGQTVGSFASRWLLDFPRPAISTTKTYEVTVRPFVRAYADRPLHSITPAEAAQWARRHPNQVGVLKVFFADPMHGPAGMRAAT